jgi:hypothetical protein
MVIRMAMRNETAEKTSARETTPACTGQAESVCGDCRLSDALMCRYKRRDTLNFFMVMLPFFTITIAGTIRAGFGWWLLVWLAYWLFFFIVWEGGVLCRHCPFWSEPGRILHCHANYGNLKIWKYKPGPMSRFEKIQFIVGVGLAVGYPFVFLILGREYVFALIGLVTVASGVYFLRKTACRRCLNFSCPANAVPKKTVDAYLMRNPSLKRAWEEAGYRLGG